MITNHKGQKLTPNQAAKLAIIDKLDSIIINEMWVINGENLTDKEIDEILRHLDKHRNAIAKKLGI
jgi:hypothetical protein